MPLLTGFGAWDLVGKTGYGVGGALKSQGHQDWELGTHRERHSGKGSIFLNGSS